MAIVDGIVTTLGDVGVSIEDVRTALGANSRDLGTLCRNANINKFARYKPVRYNKFGVLTDQERESVSHGVVVEDENILTSPRSPREAVGVVQDAAENYDWTYLPPRGGAVTPNEPYRLHDFNGYDHHAVPFLQVDVNTDKGITKNISDTSVSHAFVLPLALDPGNSQYNLHATDFTAIIDLKEWIAVAAIFDSNNNLMDIATPMVNGSPAAVLDSDGEIQGDSITFILDNRYNYSTYKIYACLYRYNSGQYEYIPFPKQTVSETEHYNKMPINLYIIVNAVDGGGGIEEDHPMEVVTLSPTHGGTSYTLDELDGSNTYVLRTQGEFHVKIPFKNGSNNAVTYRKSDFTIFSTDGKTEHPNMMWTSSTENGTQTEVSQFTIAANSKLWIELRFDTVLNLNPNVSTVVQRELTLRRNGAVDIIDDFSLNIRYGTSGWIIQ